MPPTGRMSEADLKRMLKKGEPDQEIKSYINGEKTKRTAAEQAMEHLAYEVSFPEFEAVEQSFTAASSEGSGNSRCS